MKSSVFSFPFSFFRAIPVEYGSSQAGGPIRASAAGLHHIHSNTGSDPYTTAHGNAGSLTHQVGPRIELAFSWILVRYVTTEPIWRSPLVYLLLENILIFHLHYWKMWLMDIESCVARLFFNFLSAFWRYCFYFFMSTNFLWEFQPSIAVFSLFV